jgi:hypothetical protein
MAGIDTPIPVKRKSLWETPGCAKQTKQHEKGRRKAALLVSGVLYSNCQSSGLTGSDSITSFNDAIGYRP